MPLPKQNVCGVKRKRPNEKESEGDKAAKLRRKLHHTFRELRKVVKKARTFEVQKTLKKLKDARRKDPESDVTKDLEAQVEILKHLSYNQLAHSALATKLKKDKTLSSDPTIQAISVELASNQVSPGAPGTPMAKAQSRILSSKVLASQVISIVETLRMFLHPPVGSEGIGEATDNSRTRLNIPKKRRTGSGNEDAFSSKDNGADLSDEGSHEEYESASGDEAVAEVDHGWKSGTVSAPSESDDSVADDHDSSCEDSSEADFPSGDPNKSQSHGSKGQSEFLPSLSVGFTRGDSGSEFSDSETKLVDGIKKNRRGQRARRAIWEKKFGRNANHVKKRQQQDTERRKPGSAPVDRRSGKGNSSSRPRTPIPVTYGHERVRRPTLRRSGGVTDSTSTQGQLDRIRGIGDARRKQEERPLHPSWEAKRQQKSASIVPSQGTKIVFTES
ncbi:Bud-site selection protein [Imleria badia]|nr:Bud-site selection protein [Imleria badia]